MSRTFSYMARDRNGQIIKGSMMAADKADVAAFIKKKGYYVTQIIEQNDYLNVQRIKDALNFVKAKDLAVFCRQFATIIEAGLPLITCLDILYQQAGNSKLKKAVQAVYSQVQEGESLAGAMKNHPGVFSAVMLGMVEAGEAGGVLDIVLNRLAVHYEKEYKMHEKIKSALTYPAVVLIMSVLAVVFILTFVLPTFVNMFVNMKIELPLPTRILMATSMILQQYWLYVVILLIVLVIVTYYLYQRPDVRFQLDRVIFKLPVFGILMRKVAIARFARTLATLLRGGMSIITALDIVNRSTTNHSMSRAIGRAALSVREGAGLAGPLGASGIFTPMVVQMVAVGEETGELDGMLDKIADFYESEVDDMVSRLSSLLEPIMIGVLGIIIGGIIISVLMPMLQAVTSVGL